MASKAPDYDAMAETADDAMAADEEESEASDLDAEFLMHAKEAGLSEAQAGALKLAIERCVELKGEGDYLALGEDEEGDEEAAE